jgi:hypothetical protein
MRAVCLLAGALMLAGCQTDDVATVKPRPELDPNYKRPSDAEAIARAKAALVKSLKDPESARISDVVRKTSPVGADYICGQVNAKNGFGGYTGSKAFLYYVADAKLMSEEESITGPLIRDICKS